MTDKPDPPFNPPFAAIYRKDGKELAFVAVRHAQRISSTEGIARDGNLFNTISKTLNEKDRVMVVYGAGHFLTLRPALEDLLGAGEII